MVIDESAIEPGLNIYCSTPSDSAELLVGLHGLGYKWSSGESLLRKDNEGFFADVWKGNGTFVIHSGKSIRYGYGKTPVAVHLGKVLTSSVFTPAPEADFLSLLGGFSESEVPHAHP